MEAFGTGTIVDVLRHVGTVACDSEILKMSAMTDESWWAKSLRILPGNPSGPTAFQGFIFCSILLMRGESSGEILNLAMVRVFDDSKRA